MAEWKIIGGVGGPALGGGSSSLTPPNDVSAITVDGTINPVSAAIKLRVTVTPPVGGSFVGCHLYLEIPDQSSSDNMTLDVTTLGSATVGGNWRVIDLGQYPYVATEQPWEVSLPAPPDIDPMKDISCRIYAASYSETIDNKLVRATLAGQTPNTVFTLVSLASGSPTSGTNVTGLIGGDGNVIGIVATVLTPEKPSGKLVTPVYVMITDTPPTPGWKARLVVTFGTADPTNPANQFVVSGDITQAGPVQAGPDGISTPHSFVIDTPTTIQNATVWLQAGLTDTSGVSQWNNIVPGITPSWMITFGSTVGTLDAAAVLTATIASSMSVVNGLFGVATAGITNSLLGSGAVATINIQNLAITNPLLAALAVHASNMAASSVTVANSALDTAVVQSANIAALAVGTAAIQTSAITNALIANLAVSAAKIQNATITTTQIASATIASANIATATIAQANMANSSIGTAQIQNLAVTDAKINDLSAGKITAGTLVAGVIYSGTINASQINAGTISVGSGGMTFSGTGGILITTGGSILVSGGDINVSGGNLNVLVATAGWTMHGGTLATLSFSGVTTATINATTYRISGSDVINSFGQFVGAGVNVGSNGVGCGGVNIVSGGVVTIAGVQVLAGRQTDPGAPSFASVSDAQTWCGNLRTALRNHGLI